MTNPAKIAVIGAGMIGRRHIQHIIAEPSAELIAIVDPSESARSLAAETKTPWFESFAQMTRTAKPEGVIIATPNQLHVAIGLEAIAAGIPALIEKPLADDVAEATKLVEAADGAGVALLTGHHRRHNPLMHKAREIIDSGRLGGIVAVHSACWFYKPDEYFQVEWRRRKGAGPVFLNVIHDIDNLRCLCGEVAAVHAQESTAQRGNEVEDTAVILLQFASGALGTVTLSDSVVAPWNWELTSGESPAFHETGEFCCVIGGTHASLTIPQLEIWYNKNRRSWSEPLERERVAYVPEDPLRRQIRQFVNVIRGKEPPLVSGREGLATLKVIAAIKKSAASGGRVVHL